ncbi:MAG: inositol monophosphatase [Lentisphaerae bacterium]|nr:inositol monophosphatase [Lentisphaerota bacterium]
MNQQPTLSELLDCTLAATRAAAGHALKHADRRDRVLHSSRHDVKLALDVESQEKAEAVILAAFPGHTILAEEETATTSAPATNSRYRWIIDPIDGTVNFSHHLPFWCTSIAVQDEGKTVAGVVYAPEMDELYAATSDRPSTMNDSPLHVSSTASLEKAIVNTGIYRHEDDDVPGPALLDAITRSVQRPRVIGSAALDICRVASGQAEGYFEAGIYPWDAAAGCLIVEQAGGRAEILLEREDQRIAVMATNGHVHEALKKVLVDAGLPLSG